MINKTKFGAYYIELNNYSGHYEMGKAHGNELKTQIQEVVFKNSEIYKKLLADKYDLFCEKLIKESGYLLDIQSQLPHFFEELKGISDGAEVGLTELLVWNLSEEPTFLLIEMLGGIEAFINTDIDLSGLTAHCTCLTFIDDQGRRVVAQNFDFPAFYNGYQTLFKIHYVSGKQFYIYGFAGQVGMIGMSKCNRNGREYLIAGVHTSLLNGKYRDNEGVTSIMIQRALLETEGVREACAFVERIKRSPSNSFTIGDTKSAVVLETTLNGVTIIIENEKGYLTHTNHCLVTEDTQPTDMFKGEKGEVPDFDENGISETYTVERLSIINKLLESNPNPSIETVQKVLRAAPVLMEKGLMVTLMTFIAVLDPDEPHILIANSAFDKDALFEKFVF